MPAIPCKAEKAQAGVEPVSAVVRPDPNQLNVGQRACLCGTVWEMLLIQ